MAQSQVENVRLSLENKRLLTMTGVDSVDGFSEQFLLLTVAGEKVKISGEKIKISSYNKGNGNFVAEGVFSEIKYNQKKQSFIKRLFR